MQKSYVVQKVVAVERLARVVIHEDEVGVAPLNAQLGDSL